MQSFTTLASARAATRTLKLTQMALLCAGLLACSPFGWRSAADTGAQADEAYRAGREHHLAQRPDAARAAYGAALQAEPGHRAARNALATLHAEARELTQAIDIWRDLTTALTQDAGPGRAYLFSNLGHAYLLNGDHEQARAALERACLLDPLNPRSWQLLGQTLSALGQEARAQQMHRQAAALRQHDLRADFVAAGGKTEVAALGQALAAPAPQAHPDWAQAYVTVGADGMMELRRTAGHQEAPNSAADPAPAPIPAPAQTPVPVPAPVPASVARLEIRNGNGVTGMARALSRRIDEPGVQVTRLSNQPGFAVRQTRIEYEAAHFDAARRLAQRLGSAQLQQVDECAPADLRLVLGRDLAHQGTALRLGAGQPELLSYR